MANQRICATPLLGVGGEFDNADGGASIKEVISEAIWGEINHRELHYGENRVLAEFIKI